MNEVIASKSLSTRSPWAFIPTLYFTEGLPYVIINTVSVILYKRMGIDNARIAMWTSVLYLPWIIKMLWGPFVDMYSTKRTWILSMQFTLGACMVAAAVSLTGTNFFFSSLAAFITGAFISATYDIATDGFYMLVLTAQEQAYFVGLRAGFYRLAMIFGSGVLVFLAGMLESKTGKIAASWMQILLFTAVLFLAGSLYHFFMLPHPAPDRARSDGKAGRTGSFTEIISAYFNRKQIVPILAFILLYRLGEAMLLKLVPPFLLDPRSAGGLGLATSEVGLVYGTVGTVCLVVGGILGGWLISRFGFSRCIWPMVITMHLPDLFFVYMAYTQPSIELAYVLVALEQFGYGLGFTAFTVYLMYSAEGKYKTSHYAISTGIMALGMMLPGFVSGYIQQSIGYKLFFIVVCIMTVPGMLTIPFIPKDERVTQKQ